MITVPRRGRRIDSSARTGRTLSSTEPRERAHPRVRMEARRKTRIDRLTRPIRHSRRSSTSDACRRHGANRSPPAHRRVSSAGTCRSATRGGAPPANESAPWARRDPGPSPKRSGAGPEEGSSRRSCAHGRPMQATIRPWNPSTNAPLRPDLPVGPPLKKKVGTIWRPRTCS